MQSADLPSLSALQVEVLQANLAAAGLRRGGRSPHAAPPARCSHNSALPGPPLGAPRRSSLATWSSSCTPTSRASRRTGTRAPSLPLASRPRRVRGWGLWREPGREAWVSDAHKPYPKSIPPPPKKKKKKNTCCGSVRARCCTSSLLEGGPPGLRGANDVCLMMHTHAVRVMVCTVGHAGAAPHLGRQSAHSTLSHQPLRALLPVHSLRRWRRPHCVQRCGCHGVAQEGAWGRGQQRWGGWRYSSVQRCGSKMKLFCTSHD